MQPEQRPPSRFRRIWQDHSLTITMVGTGLTIMAACIPLESGTWFDLGSGIGAGLFTAGATLAFSGPLREKNKPEN